MKKNILKIILCSCISLLFSNPKGGVVENGLIEFSSGQNVLSITQNSEKAIVNWQEFSIEKNEITKINLPSKSSAILNRVIGESSSYIYGLLESNGKVYLINENGIFIGPSGVIRTNSFIGSTKNLENDSFLNNNIEFLEVSSKIINEGKIEALDGDVLLISKDIVNKGEIKASQGKAILSNLLVIDKKQNLGAVRLLGSIENEGDIKALEVELQESGDNIYSLAINHSGLIECEKAMIDAQDGKVAISGSIAAENSLVISANSINVNGELSSQKEISFNFATSFPGEVILDKSVNAGLFTINSGMSSALFTINASQKVTIKADEKSINTLVSSLPNNTWNIVSSGPSTLNSSIAFSNIQIISSCGYDNFNISKSLNEIRACGPSSTFNINSGTVGTIKTLLGNNTYYINGGTIETLIGNGTDEIHGPKDGASWNISSNNSGNITDYINSFINVKTLSGHSSRDSFSISADIETINMEGGSLTVYNGKIAQVNSLAGSSVCNINGGEITLINANKSSYNTFNMNGGLIKNLNGSGKDVITGPSSGSHFLVTKEGSGSLDSYILFFSGIDNLIGSSSSLSKNIFEIGADIGKISMGGGINTLELIAGNINILSGDTGINSYHIKGGNITNLLGGTNNENTILENGSVGTLNMGGGSNSLTILSGSINTVNGNTGHNKYFIQGGKITSLIGGSAVEEIVGPKEGAVWNVTGDESGNIENFIGSFSALDILTGRGNDSFNVKNPDSKISKINLSEKENIFSITAGFVDELNGEMGKNVYFLEGGLVDRLKGSKSDQIIGPSRGAIWSIDGNQSGSISKLVNSFNGVCTLKARGNDKLYVKQNGVMSKIQLGKGKNELSISGGSVTDILSDSGDNTFLIEGGYITNLVGGSENNTIIGPSRDVSWNINGQNSGSIVSYVEHFSNINNLIGGSGSNIFIFEKNTIFAGSITGGAKNNTFDLSVYGAPVLVDLQNETASFLGGGFSNIQNIIASSGEINKLLGPDQKTAWKIEKDSLTILCENTKINFKNFSHLNAGDGENNFIFEEEGFVSGGIEGGSGNCTLDFSNFGRPVFLDLESNKVEGINAAFQNIKKIIASDRFSNKIKGPNKNATWEISHVNSGRLKGNNYLVFENFDTITGGSCSDTFVFTKNGELTGFLDGGSTSGNTLDLSSFSEVKINLAKRSATKIKHGADEGFINIQNFIGNNQKAVLIGQDTPNKWNISGNNEGDVNGATFFSGFTDLIGGKAKDEFIFSDQAGVLGIIDGGDGEKTLDYSSFSSPAIINLSAKQASNLNGFANIQKIIGNVVYVCMEPQKFIAKEILFDTEVTLSLYDAIRSRVYLNPYYYINYNVFSPDLMKTVDPKEQNRMINKISYDKKNNPPEKKKIFYWFKRPKT